MDLSTQELEVYGAQSVTLKVEKFRSESLSVEPFGLKWSTAGVIMLPHRVKYRDCRDLTDALITLMQFKMVKSKS